jgi:hypothetical protein
MIHETDRLTSDRIHLLTFVCWMVAGVLPLFPLVRFLLSGTELFSSRWRETPELFLSSAALPFVYNSLWLLGVLVVSWMLFRLGLRDREVWLDGERILIGWGRRLPIPMATYDRTEIQDMRVSEEKRFAMTARGGGRYGFQQRPTRWRLTARYRGRSIDLGSYESESHAQKTMRRIRFGRAA